MPFTHRLATPADIPRLTEIMEASISGLLPGFLSAEQVTASRALMGLDTQLIEDGTYVVVLDGDVIVGCGGWSRRATLYGGNHTAGRDAALLDPARDRARIRAMYTDPAHARRGIGRQVIELCEAAARSEGFTRYTLMATMAGVPLYEACGYTPVREETVMVGTVGVPLVEMTKG
ncbi:GNAT family N-acetyltransferase [Pseudokordiimonas caeni]|uniref:GNAT family N-acetyltransferase n=1 Tax=Pseudokordiimonas caeni TaxID=2997908 RepID=UPI0028123639|nr:GNAT family N-acetyltransferase [Pseudokordiimonas caeni]